MGVKCQECGSIMDLHERENQYENGRKAYIFETYKCPDCKSIWKEVFQRV